MCAYDAQSKKVTDNCPATQVCVPDAESKWICAPECQDETNCDGLSNCSLSDPTSDKQGCASLPVCTGLESEAECKCSFSNEAVLVQGIGADCKVLKRNQGACFSQSGTCLNSCVANFFRKDLGDGTALIVLGLQGSITEGWESDGQIETPSSCPALTGLEGEF